MKILVAWPPHVPSYFNAGHHLAVFTTAEALRNQFPNSTVRAEEFGLLNLSWKEIGEVLHQFQPDILVVINDFDNVDQLDRFIEYVRVLSPLCRIITGGRLSTQNPLVFRQFDIDGVVTSGDLELSFIEYAQAFESQTLDSRPIAGMSIRTSKGWLPGPAGKQFPSGEWPLPNVSEIPYRHYDRLYARDQNKFCGIPERRELVVPVGRGCPVNCSFCEVPSVQGLRDRRLSVEQVIDYIERSTAAHAFDYVSFYAPTFTFDRKWMVKLTAALQKTRSKLPWKCATAIPFLDAELMKLMADSGCIRISVGLETLEAGGMKALPLRKRTEMLRFTELNEIADSLGIEMNYFVVVGLPGTTPEGARATIQAVRDAGARARPTIYSSLDELKKCTDKSQLWRFNRQLLAPSETVEDPREWHDLLFGHEPHVTAVSERIPIRSDTTS